MLLQQQQHCHTRRFPSPLFNHLAGFPCSIALQGLPSSKRQLKTHSCCKQWWILAKATTGTSAFSWEVALGMLTTRFVQRRMRSCS